MRRARQLRMQDTNGRACGRADAVRGAGTVRGGRVSSPRPRHAVRQHPLPRRGRNSPGAGPGETRSARPSSAPWTQARAPSAPLHTPPHKPHACLHPHPTALGPTGQSPLHGGPDLRANYAGARGHFLPVLVYISCGNEVFCTGANAANAKHIITARWRGRAGSSRSG